MLRNERIGEGEIKVAKRIGSHPIQSSRQRLPGTGRRWQQQGRIGNYAAWGG
jgi:hypothetical protein